MKRAILGSIIAATLVLSGVSSVMAARGNTRDTNNFTITNYDVRLELGRDRDNRSKPWHHAPIREEIRRARDEFHVRVSER